MRSRNFSYMHRCISRNIQTRIIYENSNKINNNIINNTINHFISEKKINIEYFFTYVKKNIPNYVTKVIPENIENYTIIKAIEMFKINYAFLLYFFIIELADNYADFYFQNKEETNLNTKWEPEPGRKRNVPYSEMIKEKASMTLKSVMPEFLGLVDLGFYIMFDIYRVIINFFDPRSNAYFQ
ncbi:hypothetical protein M951_chr2156 (nucleomorph) [Lotharella oceanica]|uniref:Uncharacterized protein n=1 Tax=Lotharella oceanica TaxID=641309 RepID=A0A060DBI4_9EUKA|nr:hypothetical protein M951_chr2156 [Lotharella oceanica]|mmetsp:Transcript_4156/g.8000  ORF Transcript_4156/g.8000 Transcript_4156/m.8000 type:complete len:183 (-) Transcript_4156:514-1062(-)